MEAQQEAFTSLDGLTHGPHPLVCHPYLTCILINIIAPNDGVVEAVAHLLLARGLAGAPVHVGELSLVFCGLLALRAMRCKVWAEVFSVFLGIYLLFLTRVIGINPFSALERSTLLPLLMTTSKVLRSLFCFIWGCCFGSEVLSLAIYNFFFLNNRSIRLNTLWTLKKGLIWTSWVQTKGKMVHSAGMAVLVGTLLGVISPNSGEWWLLNQDKLRHMCIMRIYSA